MKKTIISQIPTKDDFFSILRENPGLVIIKLGAEWCGPCKSIAPLVNGFFGSSPSNVVCADIDVDECFELYGFLKSKKMVNGIPAMLCYKKGNDSFIPDESCTGGNPQELDRFFRECGNMIVPMRKVLIKSESS
jgi:thioredoxin 1